jgi:HAMP domain-containing protein/GAF domain-containing protein
VPGVAGTWQDLTENVNLMASNLTNQVRGIVKVVTAVAEGDLGQKLVVEAKGEIAALADTINNMTATLRVFSDQVTTVAREVGIEGKLGGQARVPGAAGTWRDLTDNVNVLAGNLTSQVRNIAKVTTAIANGDLSQQINVDAKGEILELKDTINAMVEKLRTFAAEVTRVAREVGTEGKLGGQAHVPGVGGTWKDLTDNVNQMASNLTDQVRGIIKVVTSVANGDLTKKFIVEAKGEIAALADTINNMTDTLRTFAEQVSTVAREVGIEGQLGGQAKVPGAAGTWRDLTDNVNQLAGNLTTQVRAISEVASAVTKGDLTRTIDVEAQGEVLSLKDTINQMIENLKDTTQTNKEQDWLKTNLAKFSQMMQGQRSLESLAQLIMSELTPLVSAQHGTFFVTATERPKNVQVLKLLSSYALSQRKRLANRFEFGEGLVGQCALERKTILVDDVPGDYVQINSSVGEASPRNILVLPVLFEGQIKGVIELASFQRFSQIHITFLEQLTLSIGVVFNMITASMRTEELLEELKGSNVELGKRTNELEEKASLLEDKNREIAQASASLEEKARQLALVSKYKSEFLANMSHELRTPLNSLLILAKLLADNDESSLTPKQVEYARTIHSAGNDLLGLINQILDLSKIEAGKLQIETKRVPLDEVRAFVEGNFRQVAEQKAWGSRCAWPRRCRRPSPPTASGCSRSSRTCSPTPSSSPTRTGGAAGRAGQGRPCLQGRDPQGGAVGGGLLRHRHRHRHRRGQAAAHLRGVPAGGRLHQPHVWRHRPRPHHQPRAGAPAGRGAGGEERPRRGQRLHPLPAAQHLGRAERRAHGGRGAPRDHHPGRARPVGGAAPGPAGPQGAAHRRRRAEPVRGDQPARAIEHEGHLRHHRSGGA